VTPERVCLPLKRRHWPPLCFFLFKSVRNKSLIQIYIKQRRPVTPQRVCLLLQQSQWPPLFFCSFNRVRDKFPLKK